MNRCVSLERSSITRRRTSEKGEHLNVSQEGVGYPPFQLLPANNLMPHFMLQHAH